MKTIATRPNEGGEHHVIIEITSAVNNAIHSAISNTIGKHPVIKAGLFIKGQAGGILIEKITRFIKEIDEFEYYLLISKIK